MTITALGYMVIESSVPEEWQHLLIDVMGLSMNESEGSADHYRLDDWQQRLTIIKGTQDRIAAVGWQTRDLKSLLVLANSLKDAGVDVTQGTSANCQARACGHLITFEDPISKMPTEIFCDPLIAKLPFSAGANLSGYETGDLGLGHVVYFVEDYQAGHDFYTDLLGFHTSDRIVWDAGEKDATFYHCNARHHSLAIMPPFGEIPPGTFNHLMLQARSVNDVGIMYDRIRAENRPLIMNLGKHTNDHTESFYFVTPSGFGLEIGCNSRTITAGWHAKTYDAPMIWGHEAPGTNS